MQLQPLIVMLLLALSTSLGAPFDGYPGYYTIVAPTHIPQQAEEIKPTCYRRWRRHTSHLMFRLARLDAVCGVRERSSRKLAGPTSGKSQDESEDLSSRVSGVSRRHHHTHQHL